MTDAKVYDPDGANLAGTETKGWAHVEVKFNVAKAGTYHLGIHNVNTCTYANLRIDNLSIKKAATSGIDTINEGEPVALVITPGTVTVSASSAITSIIIVNLQGQTIRAFSSADNSVEINTSGLAGGVYVITATTSDGQTARFKAKF